MKKPLSTTTDEIDFFTEIENTSKTKSSKRLSSCLIFLLATSTLIGYLMLSASFMQSYKQDLFKSNEHWQRMQLKKLQLKSDCKKAARLKPASLTELGDFMQFFNNQTEVQYFLCFSTLYFTVKLENYDVFRVKSNDTKFNLINNFYKFRSSNRCVEADDRRLFTYFDVYLNTHSSTETKIHLCTMKNSNVNICDLVKRFNRAYSKEFECWFNFWTGEHLIRLNENVKLVLHEYEVKLREKFYAWYFDGVEAEKSGDLYAGETNPKASLNSGLGGLLFNNNDYFDLPIHFFYTKNNRINRNFYFVNYLSAAFKLPAEIVNYFMIFYPKIWYL